MEKIKIDFNAFNSILENLGYKNRLDASFLYEVFLNALEANKSVEEGNLFNRQLSFNPLVMILYIVNEHDYSLSVKKNLMNELLNEDTKEKYMQMLISISLDKYYTNEHLAFKSGTNLTRFSPVISTLITYLNFVQGVLSKLKQKTPQTTLIIDMLVKSFSLMKAIMDLLINGFETEAFSTWRTLHENECVLLLLVKHEKELIPAYLTHMKYAVAFRGGLYTKEKTDEIFVEIKQKMRDLDLKSKDMKRFIEYGWLFTLDKNLLPNDFKLNFRDGVQKLAGLSKNAKVYEMSSEVIHSSPLLIYSSKQYFRHLSVLHLYESFFNIEKIFSSLYLKLVQEEDQKRFLFMQKIYFVQLHNLYKLERAKLKSLKAKKTN